MTKFHDATQRERTHGAGCVRQWFRTAEPLGERRYENWNTHTRTHTHTHIITQLESVRRRVVRFWLQWLTPNQQCYLNAARAWLGGDQGETRTKSMWCTGSPITQGTSPLIFASCRDCLRSYASCREYRRQKMTSCRDCPYDSASCRQSAVVSYWRKHVHEVLVNRLEGLSLPRKSVVRLIDRPTWR